MRISDWSSDVCSSDLPGGQGEKIFDAATHLLEQQHLLRGGAFLGGDVAGDLGGAQYLPRRVADGGHGQGYFDERAVLAAADRLEMIDPLAGAQAREDMLLLMQAVDRKSTRLNSSH